MKLTNYQEGFFQYLYSLVKSRGKVYVCENGKVFGREIDAKRQAHDYFERRKYKLLWAEITMDNLPLNNEEFKNVLESYNPPETNNSAKNKKEPPKMDSSIESEFNKLKEARKKQKKETKDNPPKEE